MILLPRTPFCCNRGITENTTIVPQGAIPQILEKTKEDFFCKLIDTLRESAEICYDGVEEIPCISCPNKPEGSMVTMVRCRHEASLN